VCHAVLAKNVMILRHLKYQFELIHFPFVVGDLCLLIVFYTLFMQGMDLVPHDMCAEMVGDTN
jgi:hypothetical protein